MDDQLGITMSDNAQDYGIGSDVWPGLAKLMEEMGELQQVLGKLMACSDTDAIYWDGTSLVPNILDEAADVNAALHFFLHQNFTQQERNAVMDRSLEKGQKFNLWHLRTKGMM